MAHIFTPSILEMEAERRFTSSRPTQTSELQATLGYRKKDSRVTTKEHLCPFHRSVCNSDYRSPTVTKSPALAPEVRVTISPSLTATLHCTRVRPL